MDLRQQRGLEMAAMVRIKPKTSSVWTVPSQTGNGVYQVDTEKAHCSCPDFELRGLKCKHQFAVEYVIKRELSANPDGSVTETETVTVTATRQRKTYPQNWKAYNAAQTQEGDKFQVLLHDLCSGIPNAEPKNGRPPLPLSDAVFSIAYKVYSTMSQRRFMSELRGAQERGLITKTPHFNCISNTLENADITPILKALITESSLPLKVIETDFAVDSSGFSTCRYTRWFDEKYGEERSEHYWVKAHLMCGVRTNIVTAVEIGEKYSGDGRFFAPMVKATAQNFKISEVSADAAYSGNKNAAVTVEVGGTPFIAFKANATGGIGGAYKTMYHYFMFRRDEFVQHYHKRSNIESTFSMVKRKFGDFLRSKTDTAMTNEALCKILCHNIVVLIHEMHELGIDPVFWSNSSESPS